MINQLILSLFLLLTPGMYLHGHATAASASAAPRVGHVQRAGPAGEYDVKSSSASTSASAAAGNAGQPAAEEVVDFEFDTTPHYEMERPSKKVLQAALEAAQKQTTELDILVELCKPWSQHNPDLCVVEVYEQWEKLCVEKKLWIKHGMHRAPGSSDPTKGVTFYRFKFIEQLDNISEYYAQQLSNLGFCCMGMAIRNDRQSKIPIISSRNSLYFNYWSSPRSKQAIQDFTTKNSERAAKISEVFKQIPHDKRLLPPLINIVIDYATPCVASLTDLSAASDGITSGEIVLTPCIVSDLDLTAIAVDALDRIDLPNNRIHHLRPRVFAGQTTLKKLALESNFLTRISKASLGGLINLENLDLVNNQITAIEPGALRQLPKLRKLWLAHNRLKKIPADVYGLTQQLTVLSLGKNPLEQDPVEVAKLDRIMRVVEPREQLEREKAIQAARAIDAAAKK